MARVDTLADLRALLAASAALPEFRDDAEAYALHRPAERVHVPRFAPRVKVARVLVQLAAAAPTLQVARVRVDGVSGCADFRGTVVVEDADGQLHRFVFRWDCGWRARQEGWVSPSGAPDQSRAAAAFGWRCFAEWHPCESNGPSSDGVPSDGTRPNER